MVGGAAPHGRIQVTQEGHVGRAGERMKMWAGGERERMDELRGRGSSAIWHHGRRAPPHLTLGSGIAQYATEAVGLCPR